MDGFFGINFGTFDSLVGPSSPGFLGHIVKIISLLSFVIQLNFQTFHYFELYVIKIYL